jgi:hypothetical protein
MFLNKCISKLAPEALTMLFVMFFIGGCTVDTTGITVQQGDFISNDQVNMIDQRADMLLSDNLMLSRPSRDAYLTEKMFVIDRRYTYYEKHLADNEGFMKLFGSLATIGMSTAAGVIPLGPTTKILTGTITAVTGAEKAFDQDVLLSQAVQSIQKTMRTDRAIRAKRIWNRIKYCNEYEYPIFVAMSDLEYYRRAGTFESALESLAKNTSAVETAAESAKNNKVAPSTAASGATPPAVGAALTAGVGIGQTRFCPLKPDEQTR